MITNESEMVRICAIITPHTPKELCTTAEGVEWLVEFYVKAKLAMAELQSIRTEKLVARGLAPEATSVSKARILLRNTQP